MSEPFLPNCFSQGVTFWRLVTNRSKQYLVIMLTRLVALTMDFTPRQVYRRVFLRLWTSTLPRSRISSPLKAYAIFLHFLHWLAWNVRSFFSWSSCSSLFHSLVSAFVYFIKFHLSPSKTWMQSALSNGHSTLSCLHFTTRRLVIIQAFQRGPDLNTHCSANYNFTLRKVTDASIIDFCDHVCLLLLPSWSNFHQSGWLRAPY